jgi:hypothetical protein
VKLKKFFRFIDIRAFAEKEKLFLLIANKKTGFGSGICCVAPRLFFQKTARRQLLKIPRAKSPSAT